MNLFDTAGQGEYDTLRPLEYPHTDIFLLCYSIVSPESFQNISEKRYPVVRHHCPNAPIFLVGTKSDLRNNEDAIKRLKERNQVAITYNQGANEIGAANFIECSALTRQNLSTVLEEALKAAARPVQESTWRNCCIL